MKILVLFLSVALSSGQQLDQTQNLRTGPEQLRFQGSFTPFSSGNEAQYRNSESGSSSGFYFDSSAPNPRQGGWTFKTFDSDRSEALFASGGLPDGRVSGSKASSGEWKGAISQGVYAEDSDSTPSNRNGFQDPELRNNLGLSGVQVDSTTGSASGSGFSSSGSQGSEVHFGSSEEREFQRNLPNHSERFSLQEQPNNVEFRSSGSLRDSELRPVTSEPLSKDGEVRGISSHSGVIKIDSSTNFGSQSSSSASGFAQPQNNEFQLKSSQFQPASPESSGVVTANQFDSSFTGNFGPRPALAVNDGSPSDSQNSDRFFGTEQNRFPIGAPHQSNGAFKTESANVGGFQSSLESSSQTGSFPNGGFPQISKGINEFNAGSTSSGGFAPVADSFESQFTANTDGINPAFGNSLFVFNSNNRVFSSSPGSSGLKISTGETQGDPTGSEIQGFANSNGFELDSNNSETATNNGDFNPTTTGRQIDSSTGEFDSNFGVGVQEGGFGGSGIQSDFSNSGSLVGSTSSADSGLKNIQSGSDTTDNKFKTGSDSSIEQPDLSSSKLQSDLKSSRLEVVTELSRIQIASGGNTAQFGQSTPEVNRQKTNTGSTTLQTGSVQSGIGENKLQTNSKIQAGNSGFQFGSQSSSQIDSGSRPQSTTGGRPQFRPQTGSGISHFATGSKTQSGTGSRFQFGTSRSQSSFGGSASKTGSGSTFQIGSGSPSISGSRSQSGTGSRSQTASGSRFQFGTGRGSQSPSANRSPLGLVSSHFGTGTRLQSTSGSRFQSGTGRGSQSTPAGRSQFGTGGRSQTTPGSSHFGITGTSSQSTSGSNFQFGTGSRSQLTSGARFHFGTGSRSQLNAGSGSRATSGSQFGTGSRPGSAGTSHFSLSRSQTPSGSRLQFGTGSRFQPGAGNSRSQATSKSSGFQTSSGNQRVQSNSRFAGSQFGAQGNSANKDSRTNAFQSGSRTQPTSGSRIQTNSQFGAGTSKVNAGNGGFQFGTGTSTAHFGTRNRVSFGTGSRSGSGRFQPGSSALQSSSGSTGTSQSGLGINRFQSGGSRLQSGSFGSNTRLQVGSGRVGIQTGLADRLKTESANSQDGVFEPLNLPAEATKLLGRISTSFTCQDRPYGYYADKENSCRVFHVCYPARFESGDIETSQYSFLCSEGSVFDQRTLACVPETDAIPCQESSNFFFTNEQFGLPIDKLN